MLAGPDTLQFNITWLDKNQHSTWALKYYTTSGVQTALNVTGIGDNQWKTVNVTLHNPLVNQAGILGSDFMLVNTDGTDDIFHGIEVDITRTTNNYLYFRTRQTGSWSDVNTWEASTTSDFSSGIISPATTFPNNVNSIHVEIRSQHTVTVASNVSAPTLTIENGGNLKVNSGVGFTVY
jgi:hypothetical protein